MAARKLGKHTSAIAVAPARGEISDGGVPVEDAVVDEVYDILVRMQRDATIRLAVDMGRLIVERFHGGHLSAWRKHGNKEASLRKLADKFERNEAENGMSAAGIFRLVAIYELDERLSVSSRKRLTVTHIRFVIGLPAAEQERLLDEAEGEGWTTRRLEDAVAKVRKRTADGRGRPRLPAFLKTTNLLGKLAFREEAFADLDRIAELDEDDAKDALTSVTHMRERLTELAKRLEARVRAASV